MQQSPDRRHLGVMLFPSRSRAPLALAVVAALACSGLGPAIPPDPDSPAEPTSDPVVGRSSRSTQRPAERSAKLVRAAAPADNPLRGLVPYVTADAVNRFPHSLEFDYFPLSKLMLGPETFRWDALEDTLAITARRGCQLVLRIYVEYPGRDSALPQFLLDGGLTVTQWESPDNGGGRNVTPNYADPRFVAALVAFIEAFGARYDGDPRLGFITAGLLGSWGEWHTYPRTDLWAPKSTQTAVLDAYERAFRRTPVLLRYPAGEGDPLHAPNARRSFGYHDDSFAWATLDTGRPDDSWYFEPLLRAAGARDAWRTRPIGGELRPELWEASFTAAPHADGQDFVRCVEATHVTWLMDSGFFSRQFALPSARKTRALADIARMGYVLHLAEARLEGATRKLTLTVVNEGVAPFYADWPVQLRAYREGREVGRLIPEGWALRNVLPGAEGAQRWTCELPADWVGAELAVDVPNPMPSGKPLRFANQEQTARGVVLPLRLE